MVVKSSLARQKKSIMLPLDWRNIWIKLPNTWNTTLAPGASKHFDLSLSTKKSSVTGLQVVVTLQDGSEVISPLVELQYFRLRLH